MKILILGGTGMLGTECKKVLGHEHEIVAPPKKVLDIVSWDGVIEAFQNIMPDVVINCAGFTQVDACETEDSYAISKVNVEGPRNLAQGSARFACRLVHISTDYVFDGRKVIPQPYFEDDPIGPLSAYGKSKAESETAVRENSPQYIILRTGGVYGLHGKNFVKSIIEKALAGKDEPLRVAEDQVGSPTWAYRVALQIKELLKDDYRGTYHATAEGYCTRFEWAQYIVKKLKLDVPVERCRMKDLNLPAQRPANCLIENRYLKVHGINMMKDFKEDLNEFLKRHGESLIEEVQSRND